MPYCPKCGKEVLVTDKFCLNCGESLDRLTGQAEPAPPQLSPPVPAMNTSNLYLVGDEGLLKVGTMFPLVALPVVLGTLLGLLIVTFSDFGNWVAISAVLALVIAPVVGEYRARRLANLDYRELAAKAGTTNIAWSSIQSMKVKGRTLSFRNGGGWASATIEEGDTARLSQKAASVLGGNFTQVAEGPPRLSPTGRFFLLAAALFLITEGITVAASLTPFFAGEQQAYTNLYNTVEAGLGPTLYQQWAEIFVNNVQVALAGFVPGFGSLVLGLSSYNTGRVIQVAAMHFSVSPSTFLTVLFVLPHTLVEEVSYPLAGALGLYMFAWRRQSYAQFSNWRTRASTKVAMGFGVVALILAVAAVLEVVEGGLGLGAFALWVPVVAGSIYAYLKLRTRLASALA